MIAAISTFSWLSDQIPLFVVDYQNGIRITIPILFSTDLDFVDIFYKRLTTPPGCCWVSWVWAWTDGERNPASAGGLAWQTSSPGWYYLPQPVYLSVFSSWQSCGNCWPMLFLPSHSDSQKIEVIETLVLLDWKKIDLLGHNLTDSLGPPDQPVPS